MTYHNAVKYLRQAPLESLDSTALPLLWEALNAPQRNLKYLRFTGSSGKTVCSELLISAFQKSEYVIGSLFLPFRDDGKSNIRINARPLSPEEFTSYVEQIVKMLKEMNLERAKEMADSSSETEKGFLSLSQSEVLLSVALLAFREHHCTFCIIESDASSTDPTRRLPAPFAAAICGTIPSENQQELQTIRSYVVHGIQEVVSAPQDQIAYRVISETCAAINCRLTIPTKSELNVSRVSLGGSEFSYQNKPYKLGLCGKFEITNATIVLEIIHMLSRRGYTLSQDQICDGLQETKIPAKFEVISVSPTIIVDSTYKGSAIAAICDSLSDFQTLLGKNLRLCLPSGNLTEEYLTALSPYDYSIQSVFTYNETDLPKEIARTATDSLQRNDVLLVSGPFSKTIQIRAELLKLLHK